jgi:hypothetical protein
MLIKELKIRELYGYSLNISYNDFKRTTEYRVRSESHIKYD